MTKVYLYDSTNVDLDLIDTLDDTIKNHVLEKVNIKNRKESLGASLLLKKYLLHPYSFNDNGKPICDNSYISISHSNGIVGIAISDNPVGLDIELIGKARKAFEKLNGNSLEEKYIEWTKNEAYFKRSGLGSIINPEYETKGFYYAHIFSHNDLKYALSISLDNVDEFEIIKENI